MDLVALDTWYTRLKQGTLWSGRGKCKGYAVANPGEAAKVDAYVAGLVSGGTPAAPTLATATGQGIVGIIAAGVTAAPPPPPPPPPPPSGNPSGVAMPTSISGWRTIFSDDFTTDVPVGSFPAAVSSKWKGYPHWTGTPTWATYWMEKVVSCHGSMMDIYLHDEVINNVRTYLIAAIQPVLPDLGSGAGYMNACRIDVMQKADHFGQYHESNLLWPKADDDHSKPWPGSGEIDWPEADFDGSNVFAFMHRENATSGGDQDALSASPAVAISSGWHKYTLEWVGGTSCKFFIDDRQVGSTLTSRVPLAPMRYVLQNGGKFGITPQPGVSGHVYYDWVVISVPS